MEVGERDPVSGRETTGHEWNGIKELDTPVPRWVLVFLIVTHVFAVLWWFLMPAWPLGSTYTKGLLGIDQREMVEEELTQAASERALWEKSIETSSFEAIQADPQLMEIVSKSGPQLFGDNCAACHGTDAKGREGYPDLTDDDWLWGGAPETIAETLRVGINSRHADSRFAQMPSFGLDETLDRTQIANVATYVLSLGDPTVSTSGNTAAIEAGKEVFAANCVACHGDDGKGMTELGAPNLTDRYWIYGGDLRTIIASIHGGRQGHMPTWEERLTPSEIKMLALYVDGLRAETP